VAALLFFLAQREAATLRAISRLRSVLSFLSLIFPDLRLLLIRCISLLAKRSCR